MSSSNSTPGPSPSKRRKTDKDTNFPKYIPSLIWNTNKKSLVPTQAPTHIPALLPNKSNNKKLSEVTKNTNRSNDITTTSISLRKSLKKLKFSNRIMQRDLHRPRIAFSPHSPRKLFNFALIPSKRNSLMLTKPLEAVQTIIFNNTRSLFNTKNSYLQKLIDVNLPPKFRHLKYTDFPADAYLRSKIVYILGFSDIVPKHKFMTYVGITEKKFEIRLARHIRNAKLLQNCRCYSSKEHKSLIAFRIAQYGIDNFFAFPFLCPPDCNLSGYKWRSWVSPTFEIPIAVHLHTFEPLGSNLSGNPLRDPTMLCQQKVFDPTFLPELTGYDNDILLSLIPHIESLYGMFLLDIDLDEKEPCLPTSTILLTPTDLSPLNSNPMSNNQLTLLLLDFCKNHDISLDFLHSLLVLFVHQVIGLSKLNVSN